MDEHKTTLQDLAITYDNPNWCPGCVLPSTLIQTNPSSKFVHEINKATKVLGSDGKPHQVTDVMQHIHTGPIYTLSSKYFGKTSLTPEHPVLAVRRKNTHKTNVEWHSEWIEAADLDKGDYLLYPILKEVRAIQTIPLLFEKKKKDTRSISLPEQIELNDKFLRLAGYYIAEGYIHRRSINFTFHEKEIAYAQDIQKIVHDIFGLRVYTKRRQNKHTLDITYNSSYLAEQFERWFGKGAENKKIPDFLMFLPRERQMELIKGMWRGDGWVSQQKQRANYKTISKILSEQIKMLLLRQGILPSISVYNAVGMHKTAYTVQVIDPYDFHLLQKILGNPSSTQYTQRTRPLLTKDFAFLPIRKITKQEYSGPVHNFEVETENAYVTENAILHNCGDFGIWVSLKNAIVQLGLKPWEVVIVSGIGCSSKLPYWVKTYGFNGLHGRPLPPAQAIKLANQGLTVIVIGGDGDQIAEGGNHFIHAARRNTDITLILHDNQIYGLTTGQYSPETDTGTKNKASATPVVEVPMNIEQLALAAGASFVARGFAGDTKLETQLIVEAIKHKGFAVVDSMQPCVTFNTKNTYSWFYERIYRLEDQGHDKTNKLEAFKRAEEWPLKHPLPDGQKEKIATGIFYQESRPTWDEQVPQIKDQALVKQPIDHIDIHPLIDELL